MSWISDRLPEVLWAALLISHLPRTNALEVFRAVARRISSLPESQRFGEITHTALADFPPALNDLLSEVSSTQEALSALSPLLLLEDLPGRERWAAVLGKADVRLGWESLAQAIAVNLDHQSQEATDCRWLRVIAKVASGTLYLPSSSFGPEVAKEIEQYPNYGDMRKVRPSIRAMEGAIASIGGKISDWPRKFWQQCLRDTPCSPLGLEREGSREPGTTAETVTKAWAELVAHSRRTAETTDVDPRHDTVFGTAFYAVAILRELLRVGSDQSVLARHGLRTIVECYVTLAYLLKKDDPELWRSYRVFGAGQAKLSFLKLHESEAHPSSIDLPRLEALVNEDMWLEFLPINLGHWDRSDLRKLSIEAGAKDVYDEFYSWTSTYLHGHWCAVRDTVFDTCSNPLHRLHRIPIEAPRALPDVVPDASETVDGILALVGRAYPAFEFRVGRKKP